MSPQYVPGSPRYTLSPPMHRVVDEALEINGASVYDAATVADENGRGASSHAMVESRHAAQFVSIPNTVEIC